MLFNKTTGFFENIRIVKSPHFNARPENTEISLLVIHSISLPPGKFGSGFIDDLFLGQLDANAHPYFAGIAELKVSAHFLINREGAITQYVSCYNRAWHAGKSSWQGQQHCNDFSIGIELEGDEITPYTHAQYQQLSLLCKALLQQFKTINRQNITGHSDIAPDRKTDPGLAFDWQRFNGLL
ncbi:MAG: 1,6-anhydro-N-acetylmuramyl-L-alanine amidase AmpD [Pseudomonadota bacterium]